MMRKSRSKKGFTLVELVIVIAVIAILAAVLIPTFSVVIRNANKSAARQEGTNLQLAIIAQDADADFSDFLYSLIKSDTDTEETTKVEKDEETGAYKLTGEKADFVLNAADNEKLSTYATIDGDVRIFEEPGQDDEELDDNQKKYYLEYTTKKGVNVQIHAQAVYVDEEIEENGYTFGIANDKVKE